MDLADPRYASARTMLDGLRPGRDTGNLAVELAVALGILIAESPISEGRHIQIEMVRLIILGAINMRQAEMVLADCRGSA